MIRKSILVVCLGLVATAPLFAANKEQKRLENALSFCTQSSPHPLLVLVADGPNTDIWSDNAPACRLWSSHSPRSIATAAAAGSLAVRAIQARPLQRFLHPCIAQFDPMFFAQLLVEMP